MHVEGVRFYQIKHQQVYICIDAMQLHCPVPLLVSVHACFMIVVYTYSTVHASLEGL